MKNKPAPFTMNQRGFFDRAWNSWLNVAEGGKRGGKNVLATLIFCAMLEDHPNKVHLIAGVSIAAAKLNILDCDGFGLLNFFSGRCREGKYKNRECLYVQTRTGLKIVLISGGGKDGDEKLIKGNTYGMAYVTEVNECAKKFVFEVFDRTISSRDRKVFHDLNPKTPNHWYYTDVLEYHQRAQGGDTAYGCNYGHFTIADNLSIPDDQLRSVLRTYDKQSVWYRRDILGERIAAEGLVYPMFDPKLHIVPAIERFYRQYYISIDYGVQNPTSMGLWGLSDGKWYRIREYYHSGKKTKVQKTDEETYEELEKLAGERYVSSVIVDPSAASFIVCIKKHGRFRVKKADNDVINGIRNVATRLQKETLFFNDCCENTVDEFGSYFWDEDSEEDKPIKENDHAMDDIRYFVHTILDQHSGVKIGGNG